MSKPADDREIWTIGHWVCPQELFLDTLLAADIDVLVDVRAQPGSRRSPQFGRDAMPTWLGPAGIAYHHLPELAGRRGPQPEIPADANAGWKNQSFKNYADYGLADDYREGLGALLALAESHRVCIMCGEPMPWRCHRNLIANSLAARGWTVWHLFTTSRTRPHVLGGWGAEPVVSADGLIVYPATGD